MGGLLGAAEKSVTRTIESVTRTAESETSHDSETRTADLETTMADSETRTADSETRRILQTPEAVIGERLPGTLRAQGPGRAKISTLLYELKLSRCKVTVVVRPYDIVRVRPWTLCAQNALDRGRYHCSPHGCSLVR